jgi:hypothetical protein
MSTPTFIQHVSTANSGSTNAGGSALLVPLADPAGAGNCLIAAFQIGVAVTSITDDGGNTWHQLATTRSGGQFYYIYAAYNVTSGTRNVTIAFPGIGGSPFTSAEISEFQNVATSSAQDGSGASSSGTSTTWSGGTVTTGTNGDLVWCVGFCNGGQLTDNTFFTAGSGATLCSTNPLSSSGGVAVQYQIQATAGAITPGITISASASYIGLAAALKAATAGTARGAGIGVVGRQTATPPNVAASTYHTQFACVGNLLVLCMDAFSGSSQFKITSITDSNSNTWAQAGTGFTFGTFSNGAIWYATNATPSTGLRLTINCNQTVVNATLVVLYDIANAATSALGTVATPATGDQTTNGQLASVSITPSQANSLIISEILVAIGTTRGLCGAPFLFDTAAIPEFNGGFNNLEQDNGRGHTYNPNTSALTFTWSTTSDMQGGVGLWGAMAVEFKAATPTATSYTQITSGASPVTLAGQSGIDTYSTFIAPASFTSPKFECVGGGGAGSHVTTNLRGGGGGSGGGYAARNSPTVTAYNCYTVKIGGGGTDPSGTVFNGGQTLVADDAGTLCAANSGVSAANNSITHGTFSATGQAGDTTHSGGNGGDGLASNGGGGGGGAAGTTGNGGAGATSSGGAGGGGGSAGTGGTYAGGGGAGHGPTNGIGTAGSNYGGGGGGSYRANTSEAGAAGGLGAVIFTYTVVSTGVHEFWPTVTPHEFFLPIFEN